MSYKLANKVNKANKANKVLFKAAYGITEDFLISNMI
jgi:hypothetical protein